MDLGIQLHHFQVHQRCSTLAVIAASTSVAARPHCCRATAATGRAAHFASRSAADLSVRSAADLSVRAAANVGIRATT